MPFVLLVLGLLFLTAAIRGTQGQLFAELRETFGGQPGFIRWALAIVLLGALGYVKSLRPVSNAALTLVFVALILSNRGVLPQFLAQVNGALGSEIK